MSTPTETLAAARRAVADYQRHGQMGDDRARWADFHALRAALDLLARLTAPPDEEREREIAAGVAGDCRCDGDGACRYHRETNVADDHRYLLAQLAAARAERDALRDERDNAVIRDAFGDREIDTLRREVEGMRAALASAHAAGEEKGRREMRAPVEVERLWALYRLDVEWPSWSCGECGGEYPRDIVTACPLCSSAARAIRTLPTTPPTPNPLPATGGKSNAAEVDRG